MRSSTVRVLTPLIFLVLAAVLVPCAGARGAAARRFVGDGFAVTFPAAPGKIMRKQNFGSFVLTMSSHGLDHEGMGYFASWIGDLPAAAMAEPGLDDIFYRRLEENLVFSARMSGRADISVAARSDITLNGFGGRQYVFDSAADMGVLRAYKVGLRFYAVGVFGPKNRFAAQQAVQFLESFTLTKKQ